MNNSYDCIVVGGGPAGSTVGTLLADMGRRVLILERSRFPRPHIGESLMPQTYPTFKRLGILDKLKAAGFPTKESVQFVSASGKDSQPYYFTDRDPGEWSRTWQVPRDKFDKMMLDNAREHGVEVREGVGVTEVLFEGERAVGVKTSGDEAISAKVVVDATGMNTLLSLQLGLRVADPDLKNASIYAYYKGAHSDGGRNAGGTIIIHTPDRKGWFWSIPLPGDMTSIGVVAPPSYLFTGRGDDPLATLDEEIANCPGVRWRLKGAERISSAFVTRDFSYRATKIAGDGWVLIGDAFAFLDPVYSSGVFLALKSGEMAADAIHAALDAGDTSAEKLGVFAPELLAGLHNIRQLIYAFYDDAFSFGKFNKQCPQYRDHIVRLLIGDVFSEGVDDVFDELRRWVKLPDPFPMAKSTTK
jgi:flavin-dependent dehydrogenase